MDELSRSQIIEKYNRTSTSSIRFMNDGYVDLDKYDYPKNVDVPADYVDWKYQAYMYGNLVKEAGLSTGTLVDIACGKGGGLDYLANTTSFSYLVGIDLNFNNIDIARKLNSSRKCTFFTADAVKTGLNNNTADIAISVEAFPYFSPHEKYAEEMKRIIKPGGILAQASIVDADKYNSIIDIPYLNFGFKLVKKIDITSNVRMACFMSSVRLIDKIPVASQIMFEDGLRYLDKQYKYGIFIYRNNKSI